ncbi:hypothetical protein, partial [Arthrobacter sp. JCM 19049]|uniref:hypothetical protein n=1 Tax=Arthrobacter sp. JCM 19049 TaxID=1460643 RepID=UPI000AFF7D0E
RFAACFYPNTALAAPDPVPASSAQLVAGTEPIIAAQGIELSFASGTGRTSARCRCSRALTLSCTRGKPWGW